MERLSVIRKVSTDGYKLLTVSRNHALYSDEGGRVILGFNGRTVPVADATLKSLAAARSQSTDISAVLRDLLIDSLAPLSYTNEEDLSAHAPHFLSAFTEDAEWVPVLPGAGIDINPFDNNEGPTGVTPAAAFLRQRYPGLRFEIYLDQPSYQIRNLLQGSKPILNSVWKAYLSSPDNSAPNANPLVAYGRLNDVLDLSAESPLIASRKFIVERILSPVHFKPTMLPLLAAGSTGNFGGIGTRVKGILRESNALMSSLLGVSALLASINPMVGILLHSHLGSIIQLVCASIGSICALLGMVVMVLTKVVSVLDEGVAGAIGNVLGGADEEVRVTERELTDGSIFAARTEAISALEGQFVAAGEGFVQAGWSRLNNGSSTSLSKSLNSASTA